MKLQQVLEKVDVISIYGMDTEKEIEGICYDSRTASSNQLFVAIKGYKTDGNKYIECALKAGVYGIITEERLDEGIPHIVVRDSRKALARLAANWFGNPSKTFSLIGVTGTNGKTTTTYLLKTILDKLSGEKTGLIGTNQIIIAEKSVDAERTTPESYELQALFAQMRDAGCKYVIMEVSSHALALDRVYDCDFDVGIFTNLTQDHLDFHETMENYLAAKTRLFDICKKGIINIDDEAAASIIQNTACEKFLYGVQKDCGDISAKNIRLNATSVSYEALTNGLLERISVGIPGMFSVYNSLAAVSAAMALGFPLSAVSQAIRDARGVRGRAEVVMNDEFVVVVDYAHTPDGMENILKSAKGFTKGRLLCVFGCGGDRDKTKRPQMGKIGTEMSDVAIITSDNPRTEAPHQIIEDILAGIDRNTYHPIVISDRHEAIRYALQIAQKDDSVLILGKGHETYQEINGERGHFDDREEVLMFLKKQV